MNATEEDGKMEASAASQRRFVEEVQFLGVPPTGRRATIRVMDFVRYRDGRIAEHWNVVDVAGLTAQLGAA